MHVLDGVHVLYGVQVLDQERVLDGVMSACALLCLHVLHVLLTCVVSITAVCHHIDLMWIFTNAFLLGADDQAQLFG